MGVDVLRSRFSSHFEQRRDSELSLEAYLQQCRSNPQMYSTAAERLLAAIGEAEIVDTSRDPRLGRIFANRTIRRYPAFAEFHGMEETIERIVGYLRHAAQGLEERKQILYLLGPVGGGKSSLAERLKELIEHEPIYVLKAGEEISPVFESPLALFSDPQMAEALETEFGIPRRAIRGPISPWALKRLGEFGGDAFRFSVMRMMPGGCARWGWRKPSRATRTTRTSPPWSARWTSASWRRSRRTILMPTASRAG